MLWIALGVTTKYNVRRAGTAAGSKVIWVGTSSRYPVGLEGAGAR